jgi:AraC-like DNA-binding protein
MIPIDPLTQVLVATRAGGAVFMRGDFGAPWGLAFRPQPRAIFHIVTRGTCWLQLSSRSRPTRLVQGDMVLLAHGTGHALASNPGVRPIPLEQLIEPKHLGKEEQSIRYGGNGERTALVCGAYRFDDDGAHPVLSSLPVVLSSTAGPAGPTGAIADVIRLITAEYADPAPGAAAAVTHLVDVLLIYMLRAWLAAPAAPPDWLPALRDPQIRAALGAIHAAPETPWTLDRLAKKTSMSRATLVRRFSRLVGCSPLAYVTRWRLDTGARLLRDTDATLAQIASRVGYESEFAFSKAFRRGYGMAPGRYRSARRNQVDPWREAG